MLPLLQQAAEATHAGAHPLSGTAADWLWLVALLPLLGFLVPPARQRLRGTARTAAGRFPTV